ncbi:unnamed protein product [Camellia sinensis]
MLDIDFGTYPFVTSSSPSAGGICTGLGIAPRILGDLVGVVKLGVLYKHIDGTLVKSFPGDLRVLEQLKVEYEVLPGWQCDISKVRNYSDLPKAAREYVERIEELVGIPIHYIGVGPGRDALIYK